MAFKLAILIIFVTLINFKLTESVKCKFYNNKDGRSRGYYCRLLPDSSSIVQQHLPERSNDDVTKVDIDENLYNSSNFAQSDFPFCGKFKKLKVLEVTGIKSMNENLLKGCRNLKEVEIFDTDIEEVPENLFKSCKNLKQVTIDECNIVEVPEQLFARNRQLEAISLSKNKLVTLPENLFLNLTMLEYLRLDENQLEFLPPNIFKSLAILDTLSIKRNKLQVLHAEWFQNTPKLHRLHLSHNNIAELPKNAFSSLKLTDKFKFDHNQLAVVHSDSFSQAFHINMNFAYNQINAFDSMVLNVTGVNYINMTGNVCCKDNIRNWDEKWEMMKTCFENYEPREGTVFTTTQKSTKDSTLKEKVFGWFG